MNQHFVQPIGSVVFTGAKAEIRIGSPFRKALRGLEAFSHVPALVDADGRLALKVLGTSSSRTRSRARAIATAHQNQSSERKRGFVV